MKTKTNNILPFYNPSNIEKSLGVRRKEKAERCSQRVVSSIHLGLYSNPDDYPSSTHLRKFLSLQEVVLTNYAEMGISTHVLITPIEKVSI